MKTLITILILAGGIGCRDHRVIQPALALPRPGAPLPAFALTLRDSGRLESKALTGTPAVLFLWSTHCPTSRRALAEYRELQRAYSVRGVRVVLLSDDQSESEMLNLPKVLADSGVVGEVALARGSLARLFDQSASAPERDTARVEFVLPAYVIIDPKGRVAGRSWGPDASTVRRTVDSLLVAP